VTWVRGVGWIGWIGGVVGRGGRRLPLSRHPGDQHQAERDGGRGYERADQQPVPSAQPAQPGGEQQRTTLADAEHGLQPAETLVPLGPRPALHDEQVGHGHRARECCAVRQPQQQLQRRGDHREQP
jgi:hypothetical protein